MFKNIIRVKISIRIVLSTRLYNIYNIYIYIIYYIYIYNY